MGGLGLVATVGHDLHWIYGTFSTAPGLPKISPQKAIKHTMVAFYK